MKITLHIVSFFFIDLWRKIINNFKNKKKMFSFNANHNTGETVTIPATGEVGVIKSVNFPNGEGSAPEYVIEVTVPEIPEVITPAVPATTKEESSALDG